MRSWKDPRYGIRIAVYLIRIAVYWIRFAVYWIRIAVYWIRFAVYWIRIVVHKVYHNQTKLNRGIGHSYLGLISSLCFSRSLRSSARFLAMLTISRAGLSLKNVQHDRVSSVRKEEKNLTCSVIVLGRFLSDAAFVPYLELVLKQV